MAVLCASGIAWNVELEGRIEFDLKTKHLHAIFTTRPAVQIICMHLFYTYEWEFKNEENLPGLI